MADEKKPNAISVLIDTRIKPLIDKLINFFNARNAREKIMLIVFVGTALAVLDYWVLIRPAINTFSKTLPKLTALESSLHELKTDNKNSDVIKKKFSATK